MAFRLNKLISVLTGEQGTKINTKERFPIFNFIGITISSKTKCLESENVLVQCIIENSHNYKDILRQI